LQSMDERCSVQRHLAPSSSRCWMDGCWTITGQSLDVCLPPCIVARTAHLGPTIDR
jgi:hypothetical protein